MGRLDRRKLKNIRLKKHPALKALDLILEGVDRAIAIETRARDAARLQFRRDGILLVTNATTGNRYRVCMQNPSEAPNSFVSSRQLYLMLRLTIPKLPGSASLGLWYEEVSGESLRQVRIDASDSTRVENFAGRPLFVQILSSPLPRSKRTLAWRTSTSTQSLSLATSSAVCWQVGMM